MIASHRCPKENLDSGLARRALRYDGWMARGVLSNKTAIGTCSFSLGAVRARDRRPGYYWLKGVLDECNRIREPARMGGLSIL